MPMRHRHAYWRYAVDSRTWYTDGYNEKSYVAAKDGAR